MVSWVLPVLRTVLGLCLASYVAYALLSVWAAWKWSAAKYRLSRDWTPGVTILKPVCGVDAEAYENFASFCHLDYPADRLQIIFGALDADDPALDLARQLQCSFPHLDIRIVAAPDVPPGNNRKVCNLLGMLPHARHDLLVLCDSDMRVRPDYLRRIVAPFKDQSIPTPAAAHAPHTQGEATPQQGEAQSRKRDLAAQNAILSNHSKIENRKSKIENPVGLVTCPYRGERVGSFAAAMEALGIGADFIPSTLVSRMLEGVSFALGSTIVIPRAILEEIGGLEPLVDELADDYRLGNAVYRASYSIVLSDYVIEDILGREQFLKMWARRLRWSRTLRVCRPTGYAGAFITYGFALALLFLVAEAFSKMGWMVFAIVAAVRFLTVAVITLTFTGDRTVARFLPILPLSDLLGATLYAASFFGNHISWRGERFRLLPGGRLVRDNDR